MWMTVVDITNARGDVVCVRDISHTHIRIHIRNLTTSHASDVVYNERTTATNWHSHNLFFSLPFSSIHFICFGVFRMQFDRIVSTLILVLPTPVGAEHVLNKISFDASHHNFPFVEHFIRSKCSIWIASGQLDDALRYLPSRENRNWVDVRFVDSHFWAAKLCNVLDEESPVSESNRDNDFDRSK